MVPLSHESYGRMYQPASQLLYELAILASSSGAVGKAQFVESALRELSVSLCRGNHRIVAAYGASGLYLGAVSYTHLTLPTKA